MSHQELLTKEEMLKDLLTSQMDPPFNLKSQQNVCNYFFM